jgi:hypothetical protein
MSLSLNNIISVNTSFVSSNAVADSQNSTAIFTTEAQNGTAENYGIYINSRSVELKYGSNSNTLQMFNAIISQQYNQLTAGGRIVIIKIISPETLKGTIKRAVDNNYPYFYGILTNKIGLDIEAFEEVGTYLNEIKDKQAIFDISDDSILPDIKTLKETYPRLNFVFSADENVLRSARISTIPYSFDDTQVRAVKKFNSETLIGDNGDEDLTQALYDSAMTNLCIAYVKFGNAPATTQEGNVSTELMDIFYQDYISKQMQYAILNLKIKSKIIPFTQDGLDMCEGTLTLKGQDFVNLGIIAPKKYYGIDYIGKNKDYFISTIEKTGFFVYSKPINEYTQEEMESGQAVFECAYLLSGEIKKFSFYITIQK